MKSIKLNWKNALVVSAFLHLGLGVAMLFSKLPPPTKTSTPVVIDFIQPKDVAKQKYQDDNKAHHIVEQDAKFANNQLDKNAKFLAEKSQTVQKETVASRVGAFQNTKSTKPAGKVAAPAKMAKPVAETQPTKAKANGIKDLFKQFDPSEAMAKKIAKEQLHQQIQDSDLSNAGASEDPSQTQDYVKDVQRGAETALNTREFRYFTYYNRIRRQLNQYWQPKVKEKVTTMFRKGRRIASTQDRITKLLIVLNDAGTLVKVQVLSDSGISDLDDAAIEAFRAAAPFPNPPKGIIEQDGTVRIRWDFILES